MRMGGLGRATCSGGGGSIRQDKQDTWDGGQKVAGLLAQGGQFNDDTELRTLTTTVVDPLFSYAYMEQYIMIQRYGDQVPLVA